MCHEPEAFLGRRFRRCRASRAKNEETRPVGIPASRSDSRFLELILELNFPYRFPRLRGCANLRNIKTIKISSLGCQFKISQKKSVAGVFRKTARTTVCDSRVRNEKTRLLAHSSKTLFRVFSKRRHPRSSLLTSSRAPHDCRRVVASEKVAHRRVDPIDRTPNRPSAKFSGWNASRAARSARSRPARVSFERLKGSKRIRPARRQHRRGAAVVCRRVWNSERRVRIAFVSERARLRRESARAHAVSRTGLRVNEEGKSRVVVFFVPSLGEDGS